MIFGGDIPLCIWPNKECLLLNATLVLRSWGFFSEFLVVQAAEEQHNPWPLIHTNWCGYQPTLLCCINVLMTYHHSAPFA